MKKAFYEQGWKAFMEEDITIHEEVFAKDFRIDLNAQAGRYHRVKKYDQAMMLAEKEYDFRDPNLPYISNSRLYDQMKDHPGYIALLKKMNLPVD